MSQDKEQLQALLADYVEGSLDERQIDEAEAYLAANPGVRTVVDRLMIDSEALRALPRQRVAVDFSEDFRGQAERNLLLGDATSPRRAERSLGGPMLALAAMLVIGLGLGGAGYYVLAYRPATNLDFANVTPERDFAGDANAATANARGASRAIAATESVAEAAAREEDGKAWDRVFAPAAQSVAPLMAAPTASASPAPRLKLAVASRDALPDEVHVLLDARPSPNAAIVIVVDDAGATDAARQVVNAALSQYAAGNAANDALAGGASSVELPTTVPSGEVTENVPAAAIERLRAALGEMPGVTVYDVAPKVADAAAMDAAPVRQQVSGTFHERATTRPAAAVDVYVMSRVAATKATTRPSDAP